ncbi:MAG: YbaK/EbsC family protein [Dehalococcoidia bacterium]|nr:deacylase [Chloroflexi bacterium CFX7]MCK6564231.1 YbaK/EbsC family protein [Dehalococcoidia bacterium]MCL4230675.1 YbaK/EbsC family protein [Dehalococcoidia bacterium]NUQ56545.1 YbaK/EbsC family protein [Dehalococcoidia bacterium]RIL02467.1 MAG: deacylase [bacterium]
MPVKDELETYLRDQGVAFEEQRHRVAYTAQEVAASEHVPGMHVAKVVMVIADGETVMTVLPASFRLDLDAVATALRAKEARLAREMEFAAAFPGCEVGAMPPFGNLFGIPVLVDTSLAEDERIIFQAGTHTDTMSLRYRDFERLVKPKLADVRLRR